VRSVALVGLIAGGHSGVPRYAAALTSALDRVAPEFPELSLRLLTTPAGAEQANATRMAVELVRGRLSDATGGPARILAEQLAARRAPGELLHFFDLGGPVLSPRRPFVTTIHDAAIRHGYEPVRTAHKRFLQPWAVRRARAVVAVSRFAGQEAISRFGAEPGRVRVLHSGPGLLAASAPAAAPDAHDPYLLYVGNLAAHKNLPLLIDAFGQAGLAARLVLVGSMGARFDEVRGAIERSAARDRVVLRTDVDDAELDALYAGATALVLPSLYEGFGFTSLEAMARGCPVVESDIPALREVSGDGAMLVAPHDRQAWAEALRRVVADPGVRDELRARGARTVSRYSWDATARGLCHVFAALEEPAS
jgi:glycosyltransferase involved in cell wall biosynthesis